MKYTKIVDDDIKSIIEEIKPGIFLDKFSGKTFLITGASGMIGSYLLYTLKKLNDEYNAQIKIKAVVRNEKKFDDIVKEDKNIEIVLSDIVEPLSISGDIDYIIHAASPASPKIMKDMPVETNFANTIGTANTLKLAKEKNAEGYMFVSSREIYGEPNEGQEFFYEDGPLGQVNPLIPRNGYAEGKKAAENMCVSFKEEYGLNTKIARPAHTYGPGMAIDDGRVQADFLNNVLHNEDIVLNSDGSSVRTYTYISDVIKGMWMVLLSSKDTVYNIADEKGKVSIKELAELLVSIEPEKGLKLVFNIPEDAQKGTASFTGGILSSEKIRKELGWEPTYTIKEGFERTLAHLEEEVLIKKKKTR